MSLSDITRTPIDGRLDSRAFFGRLSGTNYYYDAEYEQFSADEMARRYALVRGKMARLGVDALIVTGGPSHWSWGGGMRWLTNHWEWHCLANYVLVPNVGDPMLVYSMGGTHIESVRREVCIDDVRPSRNGRFAEVVAERIIELGLQAGVVGITDVDPRWGDQIPVNQYETLKRLLPDADLRFVGEFFHEFWTIKSEEELDCVRRAGEIADAAMQAIVDRVAPGVTEYQLVAAATHATLDAGGQMDFAILASCSMDNPSMVFGSPAPSARRLRMGDYINCEIAVGYRGYTVQIGSPICLGEPSAEMQHFFYELALPGYQRLETLLHPDTSYETFRQAGNWFAEQGYQSRPTVLHSIDLVTNRPHIWVESAGIHDDETHFRPNQVVMLEPNPISADGNFGLFVGRTYIIQPDGAELVTRYPLDLIVKT